LAAVNLPVDRLRGQVTQVRQTVSVFGVRYIVPMLTRRSTTIAVNVGGALLPVIVSGYPDRARRDKQNPAQGRPG
jgi:uncharacterized membrane protein